MKDSVLRKGPLFWKLENKNFPGDIISKIISIASFNRENYKFSFLSSPFKLLRNAFYGQIENTHYLKDSYNA